MAILTLVFANAALPQKITLIILLLSIPLALVATGLAWKGASPALRYRRFVAELRLAGPVLGLAVAAMNSFHMGQTITRLPVSPPVKALAPGIMEIATFAGLGALIGLIAITLHWVLSARVGQPR